MTDEEQYYEGTEIELVYANGAMEDERKYIVGIVDTIAGTKFGWYADCGVVYQEEQE